MSSGGTAASAARSVLRAGHAKPDRAGGDLSAARGPARPLPVQGLRRLSLAGGRAADLSPHDRHRTAEQSSKVLGGDEIPRAARAGAAGADLGPHARLCHGPGARHRAPASDGPAYTAKWIAWGAGPRAGQALILAAKAKRGARRPHVGHDRRHPRRGPSGAAAPPGNDLFGPGRRSDSRHDHRPRCCATFPLAQESTASMATSPKYSDPEVLARDRRT